MYYIYGKYVKFPNIKIKENHIYKAVSGKKLLIVHGDEFDPFMKTEKKILAHIGSFIYDVSLWVNYFNNKFRKLIGLPYWSISAWGKQKVKNAVKFIGNYELALTKECLHNKADGIVCGHIHHAEIKNNGILYMNCGDWVESCTAIGERFDGTFEIINWGNE